MFGKKIYEIAVEEWIYDPFEEWMYEYGIRYHCDGHLMTLGNIQFYLYEIKVKHNSKLVIESIESKLKELRFNNATKA